MSSHAEEVDSPLERTVELLSAPVADRSVFGSFDPTGPVGMVGVSRLAKRKERHRGIVWGMYVRGEARGVGHAWRLLSAAIAQGRATGLLQLELTVATTAQRARDLYLQAGFTMIGRLPRAMRSADGQLLDEDLMLLELA
jgi:ribosomal protein S18 acetylase RimI-like enzyme